MGATVRRLAALSPLGYDRVRVAEAEQLGVRVSTLDREVGKLRPSTDDGTQGSAVLFPFIEPWPDPVNGAELLTDLASAARDYVVLPKHTDTAIALWTLGTHVIDSLDVAPVLAISSPVMECGKTTVQSLLGRLVQRPLPSSNISPSAVFRAVEAWSPTLLIDEADSSLPSNEEMRGILNSGHTRDSAFVVRVAGDDLEPRRFSTCRKGKEREMVRSEIREIRPSGEERTRCAQALQPRAPYSGSGHEVARSDRQVAADAARPVYRGLHEAQAAW